MKTSENIYTVIRNDFLINNISTYFIPISLFVIKIKIDTGNLAELNSNW